MQRVLVWVAGTKIVSVMWPTNNADSVKLNQTDDRQVCLLEKITLRAYRLYLEPLPIDETKATKFAIWRQLTGVTLNDR